MFNHRMSARKLLMVLMLLSCLLI